MLPSQAMNRRNSGSGRLLGALDRDPDTGGLLGLELSEFETEGVERGPQRTSKRKTHGARCVGRAHLEDNAVRGSTARRSRQMSWSRCARLTSASNRQARGLARTITAPDAHVERGGTQARAGPRTWADYSRNPPEAARWPSGGPSLPDGLRATALHGKQRSVICIVAPACQSGEARSPEPQAAAAAPNAVRSPGSTLRPTRIVNTARGSRARLHTSASATLSSVVGSRGPAVGSSRSRRIPAGSRGISRWSNASRVRTSSSWGLPPAGAPR